jgi:hypothetical protein
VAAFQHSLSGGVLLASVVAAAGSLVTFARLPARPRAAAAPAEVAPAAVVTRQTRGGSPSGAAGHD